MQEVGKQIKAFDHELDEVEEKLDQIMLSIPNIPMKVFQLEKMKKIM